MKKSNKYSEIEITNSEVIKLLDIASCYIIVTVITAKTEKRILELLRTRDYEIYTTCSDKWKKEERAIFAERVDFSKEIDHEELDKREKVLNETKKREKKFLNVINTIISELEKQEKVSEKINNSGIKIEENEYQKSEYVLKENIKKFISEKEEGYKLIESELTELKEFEQIENEEINVDEIIEELKLTAQFVQKIQAYI